MRTRAILSNTLAMAFFMASLFAGCANERVEEVNGEVDVSGYEECDRWATLNVVSDPANPGGVFFCSSTEGKVSDETKVTGICLDRPGFWFIFEMEGTDNTYNFEAEDGGDAALLMRTPDTGWHQVHSGTSFETDGLSGADTLIVVVPSSDGTLPEHYVNPPED